MVILSIVSVILSGSSLGLGAVILKATKAVTLWGIRLKATTVQRKIRVAGTAVFLIGIITVLFSFFLLYKACVNQQILFVALCACLWVISLVIGGVWGDFVSSKHRDFSKDSLASLSKTKVLKTAENKLINAYGAVIGFEGIAFISKEGRVCDRLYFANFGLKELSRNIETDILCQYFKSIEPQKEIHSLSNKLSVVFNINAE